jgi:hypothetical protein
MLTAPLQRGWPLADERRAQPVWAAMRYIPRVIPIWLELRRYASQTIGTASLSVTAVLHLLLRHGHTSARIRSSQGKENRGLAAAPNEVRKVASSPPTAFGSTRQHTRALSDRK